MDEALSNMRAFLFEQLPFLVIPIAILVGGWVAALLISWLVSRALRRLGVNRWVSVRFLGKEPGDTVPVERWASKGVYYVVLLFTLLGFLQAVNLTAATEPVNALLRSVFEFVPQLVGALLILLTGWLVASLLRRVLAASLRRWDIDRQLSRATGDAGEAPPAPYGMAAAQIAFWLVLLLFVPATLSALRLEGMLAPFGSLVEKTLAFLPNLGSAVLVLAGGWLLARILQHFVTSVLLSLGTEQLRGRLGLEPESMGGRTISSVVGNVVYGLVLIPVAVAALNALRLDAVTAPASSMLSEFFAAVPAIFGAAVIIAIAYVAGRLLKSVVANLLSSLGFDRALTKLGIARVPLGEQTLSELAGGLVMLAVVYFACMEAASLLGLDGIAALAANVAVVAGRVLLGLVILGFGLFFAQVAAKAVETSAAVQARALSIVVRTAVLTLAGAMALRQMGLANEIIVLAFGLVLGSVAVACAVAFGLGGREVAARAVEELRGNMTRAAPPSRAAPQPHSAAPH